MSWKKGLTWTHGHEEITTNPDGTREPLWVHGGPFYFHNGKRIYLYVGFRPTPTWGPGYGDEGWFGGVARWLKRKGWGNIGIALRKGHGA